MRTRPSVEPRHSGTRTCRAARRARRRSGRVVAERGGLVEGAPDLGGGAQLDRLVAGGHRAAAQVRVLGDVGGELGDELGELGGARASALAQRAQAPDLGARCAPPSARGPTSTSVDPAAGELALEPVDRTRRRHAPDRAGRRADRRRRPRPRPAPAVAAASCRSPCCGSGDPGLGGGRHAEGGEHAREQRRLPVGAADRDRDPVGIRPGGDQPGDPARRSARPRRARRRRRACAASRRPRVVSGSGSNRLRSRREQRLARRCERLSGSSSATTVAAELVARGRRAASARAASAGRVLPGDRDRHLAARASASTSSICSRERSSKP